MFSGLNECSQNDKEMLRQKLKWKLRGLRHEIETIKRNLDRGLIPAAVPGTVAHHYLSLPLYPCHSVSERELYVPMPSGDEEEDEEEQQQQDQDTYESPYPDEPDNEIADPSERLFVQHNGMFHRNAS